MQRWMPRLDFMLDRIPSASQRAIVPYLWLSAVLLVLHCTFCALSILPSGDAGGLAVLERTATLWRLPIAYLALAIAWMSAGCAIAAVIDSQPRTHRPYLIAAALVPPLLIVRQALAMLADRRRHRVAYAYGWSVRFSAAAIPFAILAPFVDLAAAAACLNLVIGLALYTIRSIRPALRWPRRRMMAAMAIVEAGLAILIVASVLDLFTLIAVGGAVTGAGAIVLCSALALITAERSTAGTSVVDAPVRRLAWPPARSTK